MAGNVLLAEPAFHFEPQLLRKLRVVAQLRMGVEGQMVSKQADIMAQQQLKACALHPGNPGILIFPEIAVVHQDRICTRSDGCFKQIQAGCHATYQLKNTSPPFYLHTIWAIITEAGRIQ